MPVARPRLAWTSRSITIVVVTAVLILCYFGIALPHSQPLPPLVAEHDASLDQPAIPHDLPLIEPYAYIDVDPAPTKSWPFRRFKSAPYNPVNISITRNQGGLAPGYFFFSTKSRGHDHPQEERAYIFDADNEMVFAGNSTYISNNFRVVQINDRPYLTWWDGLTTVGHGYGNVRFLDQEYRETIAPVSLDVDFDWSLTGQQIAPGTIDFHEQAITPQGTLLVTLYNHTAADLLAHDGPRDGWLADSLFYEIDLTTREVLFRWSALDHIPLGDSLLPVESYMSDGSVEKPWDYFHINSIQDLGHGFLINARHTWSSYLISREDGRVLWELSGRGEGGSFAPLPEEAQFRWQHHAVAHNVTSNSMDLSLFDNHNMADDNGTLPSRGLVFRLDLPPNPSKPPTLLHDITAGEGLYADSQGSYETDLGNGNQLLSYGPIPVIREFGPAAEGSPLLWEGRFGPDNALQTYRAFKQEWHGTPKDWGPSLVVEGAKGYVSWNGATDIEAWHVYEGDCAYQLKPVAKALKRGFETVFAITAEKGSCVQVAAVRDDEEIRHSNRVLV